MKNTLKKLKLIDHLTMELNISRNEFVNKLKKVVDKGDIGFFSDIFDGFSSSNNELKGQVDYNGFKIKRRKRFFDTNMNFAFADGIFNEQNGTLKIETEINGFSGFFIPFYIILIIFYSIFILAIGNSGNNERYFAIPFLIFHATLMFGIPYFMMRRSVKRLKYELEREFYYIAGK
jgi:hypothetical protein